MFKSSQLSRKCPVAGGLCGPGFTRHLRFALLISVSSLGFSLPRKERKKLGLFFPVEFFTSAFVFCIPVVFQPVLPATPTQTLRSGQARRGRRTPVAVRVLPAAAHCRWQAGTGVQGVAPRGAGPAAPGRRQRHRGGRVPPGSWCERANSSCL